MTIFVEPPHAYSLARGMARVAGVPLAREVIEGRLTRAQLSRMVARCQICPHAQACAGWLSVLRDHERLPDFCANRPDIETLARRTEYAG